MATTNSITTTYAGEAARGFVSAALLSSPTIFGGGVTVYPNVKYKQVLKKLDTNQLLKDASCDFTADSTLTQTERILTPKSLQVNLQLCKADYRDTWDAISMGYSAHDVIPPDFASYLVGYAAEKVAAENEVNIWQGATGNSGEFDGFETLLASNAAQPAGQEIAGTTLSKANIVAQVESVVDVIPSAVWSKDDLYIYMGTAAYKFYIQAQAASGAMDLFQERRAEPVFQGIPIFHAPGMSANKMVACRKSDLAFGTGLLSDHMEVKVLDMADLDGSENVRIVMRLTAGAQFVNGSDIVTYGITNSAN